MKNFVVRFFFSEYLAVPFSIWLLWLLLFDSTFLGGRLIEHDVGGAFILFYICLFYLAIQGISALANVKEGHGKLRADVWISSIPFFIMAGIAVLWMIPEETLMSWNIPSQLTSRIILNPEPFIFKTLLMSAMVVFVDVFMFGIFAGNLRSFINREKLAAAERRSTGKNIPVAIK